MTDTYDTPESTEQAEPEKADHSALFERAKERIEDYKEVMREQHDRIREDLRFSNPANPEQWSATDVANRGNRPTLTLDRTNQFILQVANDMRQNNAGIEVIPADGQADAKAAETLESMVRHIEYCSRAPIAYSTGSDLQVRCGLGWLRGYPEKCDSEMEIRIGRITDPTAAGLDLDCTEPDGAGAKWGFVEGQVHIKTFRKLYPGAAEVPIGEEGGWRDGEFMTVAEYFEIDEETGEQTWTKLTGASIVADPIPFPCKYIALVPIVGYEVWVDGKRFLCGLTRRLMDGQRLHNFEMSAIAEFLASQPKAPIMAPAESMAGYEKYWKGLATGNPSFLPFKALDAKGQVLPAPQRMMPPPMPGAYAQMAQFATEEMQASVGMYKANLGQQGNETSGRAIRARQMEGDVATLQFPGNHGLSQAQLGRCIVDMIPKVYTKQRIQRIVGIDGESSFVQLNPSMKKAVRLDPKGKVKAFNPNVGVYDVIVKSGPSYTTMREETVDDLAEMIKQQPQLAPVLGPMWARLRNMPQGDKISKLLLAMAPPQVQAIEGEDQDIPPQVAAQMQQMKQQMAQMNDLMGKAAQHIQQLESEQQAKHLEALANAAKIRVDHINAETNRIKALGAGMTAPQVQALVMQVLQEVLSGGQQGGQQPPAAPMLIDAGAPPDQPLLPDGMDTNGPPGQPQPPDPGALPDFPLAHQAPAPSNEPPPGGSPLSEAPQ